MWRIISDGSSSIVRRDMEIWRYGDMEIWRSGGIGVRMIRDGLAERSIIRVE